MERYFLSGAIARPRAWCGAAAGFFRMVGFRMRWFVVNGFASLAGRRAGRRVAYVFPDSIALAHAADCCSIVLDQPFFFGAVWRSGWWRSGLWRSKPDDA